MRKIGIILFFILFTVLAYGEIYDEIKLLKDDEKAAMNSKLQEIESNFGIKFKVVISENQINVKQYSENLSKGVIVHLLREKKQKLLLRLYFTKDIDINTYKEEMQKILDDSQTLVDAGKYIDLIYEITGSITEVIILISAEEKAEFKRNIIITAVVIAVFVIIGLAAVFMIIMRAKRNKRNLCRFCDIEMDLVDEYKEENKVVRLYNCHVCGHSKKISFRH